MASNFWKFIWGTWYWVLLYFFFGIVRVFGSELLWKKDQTTKNTHLSTTAPLSVLSGMKEQVQLVSCHLSRDVEDGIVRIIIIKSIYQIHFIRITHDGHCFIKSTSTLKIKVFLLEWFHAEPLTSMHGNFQWTTGSSMVEMFFTLLKTVHWKVLWGTQNGTSIPSLRNSLLEPLFLRVYTFLSLNVLMHSQICQIVEINWVAKTNSHWLYHV